MSIKNLQLIVGLVMGFLSMQALAVTFIDIWEYQVEGVESIDAAQIQAAVAPYLGAARTIEDVDKAAQAIQKLYQQAGYPTTAISVPQQDIVGGVIRIKVDESRIRRVRIAGSRYFSLEEIRKHFPSLKSGEVLNLAELQADAKNMNRVNRDLKVVPALKAGPVPGSVDIDLNVADELPIHGGFEVTNYHTENTTPTRASADIKYGNLWQANHEASLQVQVTPEDTDEVKVLAGSYLFPLGDNGGKVAAYTVLSDSQLAAVNDINVIGKGTIWGLRWIQPIAQTKSAVHSVSVGGDYKDFDEDLEFRGGDSRKTPISYTSFSAQYTLYYRSKHYTDSFSTGFTFGTRLLNDPVEFNEKKFHSDPSFSLWKVDWKRNFPLPKNWQFSHQLRGQYSDSPLVSNEAISAGGVSSVRGYFESQIQGDKGVIANLELTTPSIGKDIDWLTRLNGRVFYDAAKIYINDALADQQDEYLIQSVGVGMNLVLLRHWQFKLDGGLALKDQGGIGKNDFRARASARYEF